MKRSIIFMLMFLIPLKINADSVYNDGIELAKNYITGFGDYNEYFLIDNNKTNNYILNPNGPNFWYGGYVSKDEYDKTIRNNYSWLSPGFKYWTNTPYDINQKYIIDLNSNDMLNKTQKSGIRLTEFVKSNVVVSGSGTKNDPWYFENIYKVYVRGNVPYGYARPGYRIFYESTNDEKSFDIIPKIGYVYDSFICNNNDGIIKYNNNKLYVSEVKNNINCIVKFKPNDYIIDLNNNFATTSGNEKIYTKYNTNVYLDNSRTKIMNTTSHKIEVPLKEGYKFLGYFYNVNGAEINVINKDGYITVDGINLAKNYYENKTWHAKWLEDKVTYNIISKGCKCANRTYGSAPYIIEYSGKCELIDDGNNNWKLKLLSSGTLKTTRNIKFDAFAVGGGGGGASGGGGGGYTSIVTKEIFALNNKYNVKIGSGGSSNYASNSGYDGSPTRLSNGSNIIVSAKGGKKGNAGSIDSSSGFGGAVGGAGGAGSGKGGKGGWFNGAAYIYDNDLGGGGEDGKIGNLEFGIGPDTYGGGGGGGGKYGVNNTYVNSGSGKSGGGHGGTGTYCGSDGESGTENTGGGGGGALYYFFKDIRYGSRGNEASCNKKGGKGGSGILIIRNAR